MEVFDKSDSGKTFTVNAQSLVGEVGWQILSTLRVSGLSTLGIHFSVSLRSQLWELGNLLPTPLVE